MTSDRVEIRKWNSDAEEYQLVVTYYPDGSIEGDDDVRSLLDYLVREIKQDNEDPVDWFPEIAAALATNWNNAVYDSDVYLE